MTALAFIGGVFGPRRRRRRSTPSPPNTRFPTASGGFIGTPKSRFDDDALLADTDCCSARRSSGCPARSLTTTGRYLTFMPALHSPPSLASLALRARDLARSLVARACSPSLNLLLTLLIASNVRSIPYETGLDSSPPSPASRLSTKVQPARGSARIKPTSHRYSHEPATNAERM